MEGELRDVSDSKPKVKATLSLGSEKFSICSDSGILSQQLASMKEQAMTILKEYITKHNAPTDVPDEVVEGSSSDESEELDAPAKKSKTQC